MTPETPLATDRATALTLQASGRVVLPPRFEMVRLLGQGGMSAVYLARDAFLGRSVAIKLLVEGARQRRERFLREARVVARLSCPAIVRVYDLGEAGETTWIAMEYVDGQNLAQAALGRRELLQAIREVAAALVHAHAHGVIHRDLKPENILIDRLGRARLTDFGLARDLLAKAGPSISFEGSVLGTPAFMPPEQARGDSQAVDGRSDVYSLGATLFAKLCGRRPFAGETVVDVLHAVLHEPAPRLRAFVPDAAPALEALVGRCLAKEPRARFPSMAALVAALDDLLARPPASASSPTSWLARAVQRARRTLSLLVL